MKENIKKLKGIYPEQSYYGLMGLTPLTESNINSIMNHRATGFIIISSHWSSIDENDDRIFAFKIWCKNTKNVDMDLSNGNLISEFLHERNDKAEKDIFNDILASGYSYTKVYGGYHNPYVEEEDEYEPSYIVYNFKRSSEPQQFWKLEKFGIDLCGKYIQDCVYIQRPNEAPIYLDKNGNKVNSSESSHVKVNRDDEMFFTTVNRKKNHPKRFTSDIQFESFHCKRSYDYLERMKNTSRNEIMLN